MKRIWGMLIIVALAALAIILTTLGIGAKSTVKINKNNDSITVIAASNKSQIKQQQKLAVQAPLLPSKIEFEKSRRPEDLQADYQVSAAQLARQIEKYNLSPSNLNQWASELSHTEFMQKLPEEVQKAYRSFEKKIEAIQKMHMAEDGMDPAFFTQYKIQIPSWIKDHRQALQGVGLPTSVSSFVSDKSHAPELTNQDIRYVLNNCGKGNTTCIEKSFAILIDANHALSEPQLEMIKEYL